MTELIKINWENNTVNARELHGALQVKTRFNEWVIDKINKYKFLECVDYIAFTENSVKPQGGRPCKEYHISIDMAKQLAMVENNDQGRRVRLWFIECEKIMNNPAHRMAIALKDADKIISAGLQEIRQLRIENMALKQQKAVIEYKANELQTSINQVSSAEGYTNYQQSAKVLGVNMTRLINYLKDKGYIGNGNIPYAKYCEGTGNGWFTVKKSIVKREGQQDKTYSHGYLTNKGLLYFAKTFIKPLINNQLEIK